MFKNLTYQRFVAGFVTVVWAAIVVSAVAIQYETEDGLSIADAVIENPDVDTLPANPSGTCVDEPAKELRDAMDRLNADMVDCPINQGFLVWESLEALGWLTLAAAIVTIVGFVLWVNWDIDKIWEKLLALTVVIGGTILVWEYWNKIWNWFDIPGHIPVRWIILAATTFAWLWAISRPKLENE